MGKVLFLYPCGRSWKMADYHGTFVYKLIPVENSRQSAGNQCRDNNLHPCTREFLTLKGINDKNSMGKKKRFFTHPTALF